MKILFFAANAVPDKLLDVGEEYRAIEQSIRLSRYREAFQLIPQFAAREGDLQRALLEHQPDIVHFACHGSLEREVLLLAEDGEAASVSTAALTSMFCVLRDNLALVVFNACWSREQAAAIRQSAGLCIGMRESVGDIAAIKFAAAFYGALGYGRSVREAFELGKAIIKTSDPRRRDVPQLFEAKDVSAGDVVFVREPQRPRFRRTFAVYCGGALLALVGWLWALRPWSASVWEDENGGMLHVAHAEAPPASSGPPQDMVRFRSVSIQPGVFDLRCSRRPVPRNRLSRCVQSCRPGRSRRFASTPSIWIVRKSPIARSQRGSTRRRIPGRSRSTVWSRRGRHL